MGERLTPRWLPLREAARFVAQHHRHHDPMQGGIVAIGLWHGQELIGVAVIGRPVSRMLQQQGVCEFVRTCVRDDWSMAASQLLARARRVAATLGFPKAVTYTLPEESGSSLLGDGWVEEQDGEGRPLLFGGGEWTRPSRAREIATAPTGRKRRWWHDLDKQPDMLAPGANRGEGV